MMLQRTPEDVKEEDSVITDDLTKSRVESVEDSM
jgi:hypothetical protein